ncbi:MAG: imidazole glycerol phosphate synthase subunit HisH [Bacteroidota bacterium]
MNVVIVAYNGGNVLSLQNALKRLGVQATLSSDEKVLKKADRVIFPGVGSAASAMPFLREKGLDRILPELQQPVLGICLGMQLLCDFSEEGDTPCLGIIPQQVRKFRPIPGKVKVPHMGWNQTSVDPLEPFSITEPSSYYYFVHSYYVEPGAFTTEWTEHGIRFSAALRKDNFWATQFHPEKSGAAGSQLLQKFLSQKFQPCD